MALFDDVPRKVVAPHVVGQDVSLLSVEELTARLALLREEIARLEAERQQRGATLSAAEKLFRR